jgi:hypothetical protein
MIENFGTEKLGNQINYTNKNNERAYYSRECFIQNGKSIYLYLKECSNFVVSRGGLALFSKH